MNLFLGHEYAWCLCQRLTCVTFLWRVFVAICMVYVYGYVIWTCCFGSAHHMLACSNCSTPRVLQAPYCYEIITVVVVVVFMLMLMLMLIIVLVLILVLIIIIIIINTSACPCSPYSCHDGPPLVLRSMSLPR